MTEPTQRLIEKKCIPCAGDTPPLKPAEWRALLPQVPGWEVIGDHHLDKGFRFDNFVSALAFVNKVGALSEQEGHHPDIHLAWGRVRVTVWTHAIDGLSEADFVLAAKIDTL